MKVNFPEKIEVGGIVLEGEVEVRKPNMSLVFDVGELISIHNQIGFMMGMVSAMTNIPLNQLKELDADEYQKILDPLLPHLPKI